jgi:hypothetical protein
VPRLLDLELSQKSLVFRLVSGILAAALTFLVFYFIPANIMTLVSGFIPSNARAAVNAVLSSIISPAMPLLGLFLTVLAFLSSLLRGSKVHGPIIILEGLCFIAYLYLTFQGGIITITLPKELLRGLSASLQLGLVNLMLLCMVPSLLTVVKGVILTLKKG